MYSEWEILSFRAIRRESLWRFNLLIWLWEEEWHDYRKKECNHAMPSIDLKLTHFEKFTPLSSFFRKPSLFWCIIITSSSNIFFKCHAITVLRLLTHEGHVGGTCRRDIKQGRNQDMYTHKMKKGHVEGPQWDMSLQHVRHIFLCVYMK